jgi:hypothetical protein
MTTIELHVRALKSLREDIRFLERERKLIKISDNDEDLIREAIENKATLEMIKQELENLKLIKNLKTKHHEIIDTDNRNSNYMHYFNLQSHQERTNHA